MSEEGEKSLEDFFAKKDKSKKVKTKGKSKSSKEGGEKKKGKKDKSAEAAQKSAAEVNMFYSEICLGSGQGKILLCLCRLWDWETFFCLFLSGLHSPIPSAQICSSIYFIYFILFPQTQFTKLNTNKEMLTA